MPVFRSNSKAVDMVRDMRAFLSGKTSERREYKRIKNKITNRKRLRNELKSKRQEFRHIREELRAAKEQEEIDKLKKSKERIEQEIFQLEEGLHAARDRRAESEHLGVGALPDFLIIGAMKAGTTFLYNLLVRHPLVEPATLKELHYFDNLIEEEGIEWYRRCFPQPRWEDGRKVITGEATPDYLSHPLAPERAAQVVPEARLIALLRNPVDRAYSHYHQVARQGREPLTFEEAIEAKQDKPLQRDDRANLNDRCAYLSRGIYVDQLLRWSRFFSDEQMLVLKSEDLYEHGPETLRTILRFLDLPDWEPEAWRKVPKKRNRGRSYKRGIDPATRRRLEEYFEPHNNRLYEHLGVDFGW